MITTKKRRPTLTGIVALSRRLGMKSHHHLGRVLWGDSKPSDELAAKLRKLGQPYGEAFVKAQSSARLRN